MPLESTALLHNGSEVTKDCKTHMHFKDNTGNSMLPLIQGLNYYQGGLEEKFEKPCVPGLSLEIIKA
jgi:hypothetical protein